ncbi:hypothetical protein [Salipaludibacillus aurantiacus]|uniref:Uncharacterized protein n=1 Tax=Salipaludibacillus aurantiacus TaxID=1601833 RepID=A0A1H9W5S0_9BACI|nr:hypothetical protein [Salipaludibacillus aurantiacus]SES29129.1 hypothetical protein SAMN05518684_11488 [Salipaludibacillus aurantiacus]
MRTKKIQNFITRFILDRSQLLKIEELDLSSQAKNVFDDIYYNGVLQAEGQFIDYRSSYPVYQFLNYMIENKDLLVHGSNNSLIERFEPKESTLFNGRPVKAVFASSDGVWSLFFAVKNRRLYSDSNKSLRNLCYTVPAKKGIRRYYYFSINNEDMLDIWTKGTIYFFFKNSFIHGGIRDEWVCKETVRPIAKLSVKPADFPFLEKTSKHAETDSMIKTLLKAFFIKK